MAEFYDMPRFYDGNNVSLYGNGHQQIYLKALRHSWSISIKDFLTVSKPFGLGFGRLEFTEWFYSRETCNLKIRAWSDGSIYKSMTIFRL